MLRGGDMGPTTFAKIICSRDDNIRERSSLLISCFIDHFQNVQYQATGIATYTTYKSTRIKKRYLYKPLGG